MKGNTISVTHLRIKATIQHMSMQTFRTPFILLVGGGGCGGIGGGSGGGVVVCKGINIQTGDYIASVGRGCIRDPFDVDTINNGINNASNGSSLWEPK